MQEKTHTILKDLMRCGVICLAILIMPLLIFHNGLDGCYSQHKDQRNCWAVPRIAQNLAIIAAGVCIQSIAEGVTVSNWNPVSL